MDQTTPKPFVFVLMPFDEQFTDIYQLGIKAACKDAGGYCERVDEQIFHESILERVYNQIAKADLLIADMTGRNPNVFYEVGYAHALGRPVILLTQKSDDIPFDLKHYPHIVYGGKITELKQELEKHVRWAFENAQNSKNFQNPNIRFSINNQQLIGSPTIECLEGVFSDLGLGLDIDMNNSTEKTIEPAEFQIGFIIEKFFPYCGVYDTSNGTQSYRVKQFNQPDNKILQLVESVFQILPGSWEKIFVRLDGENGKSVEVGKSFDFVLRTFSANGTQDYPFKIRFN
jgi:hypothetical protein